MSETFNFSINQKLKDDFEDDFKKPQFVDISKSKLVSMCIVYAMPRLINDPLLFDFIKAQSTYKKKHDVD